MIHIHVPNVSHSLTMLVSYSPPVAVEHQKSHHHHLQPLHYRNRRVVGTKANDRASLQVPGTMTVTDPVQKTAMADQSWARIITKAQCPI